MCVCVAQYLLRHLHAALQGGGGRLPECSAEWGAAHVACHRLLTWESDPKDYASDRPSPRSQDLNSFLTFYLQSSNLSLLVRICPGLI